MPKNNSVERVNTDLEIDEHLPMHERGWKAQLVGLYLIFALVLTAALGLYGDGLLSKKTIQEGNAIIEFQQFYRFEARMELKVELNSSDNTEGLIVSFPTAYLKNFQMDSMLPEPEKNIVKEGHVQYLFNGTGNINVTFFLIPKKVGKIDGSVQVNSNQFQLNHFIFP
jgi:hypothetical protein